MDPKTLLEGVRTLAAEFAGERRARQQRRELDPADFERLRATGFQLTGVPVELGGLWETPARSTRMVCELLRALARGDSSVALVSAMHPSVLAFWLAAPTPPTEYRAAWDEQVRTICQTILDGAWWGTINSEPGSGGDLARTKAVATRDEAGGWRLSGDKQFGSGSGVTSFMITVARPEGEQQPDLFYLDLRDARWDGSTGMQLLAPWDGHGMTATQSHAFRFSNFPATRVAWPGGVATIGAPAQPAIRSMFTAVIVGVVEEALATARAQIEKRQEPLRPYERIEWARAELEGWLLEQAYEGMLRSVEREQDVMRVSVQGKLAAGELAESALTRICRVIGGGSFSRSSPFGHWAQDVKALGFLRPPWALAMDALYQDPWATPR